MMKEVLHNCNNKKWRHCVVEAGFCKNCKKCVLEKGDIVETVCTVCNEKKRCKVDRAFTNSTSKEIVATCKHCNAAEVAVEDLKYQFLLCEDEKFSNVLDQVLDLPRDDLRVLLKSLRKRRREV
jgi:hypothetical protein